MRLYELTYLIPPNLAEEEIKSLQEKIVSQIQEIGGILNETSSLPIKKSLNSPIKKVSSAFLATLSFQLSPEKLQSFEKGLKAEGQVLRYMILTKPPTTFRKKVAREKPAISRRKVAGKKVELKEIEKKLEEILKENESK